jgi:hypothetical protein
LAYPGYATAFPTQSKQLLGIPWRVAFALQADGWWLRSAIVWAKPNPMPESVRDRPSSAYEHVFLLAKAPRYFYDAEALRTPLAPNKAHAWARTDASRDVSKRLTHGAGSKGASGACGIMRSNPSGANARNVWTIAPRPYRGAHFATMPVELAERCIRAGTSERGQCPHCAAPWARVVEREPGFQARRVDEGGLRGRRTGKALDGDYRGIGFTRAGTTGWAPSCACPAHEPVPQTVLDPFAGAGTTALAARNLGRDAVLVELNPEYADLARVRLASAALPSVGAAATAALAQESLFA